MADPYSAMKTFRRWLGTLVLVATAAWFICRPSALHSQQIQATNTAISYEGQHVSSVQLAGQPDGNVRELRKLIQQPVNAPFEQAKVDATIEALKKAGVKDVEARVTPAAEGVEVVFVLKPAAYFGVYSFSKAEKVFSYTRLLQTANYAKQEPYSQEKVEEAESNLLDFFHRAGYFSATVEPKLENDQKHGIVNVAFDVNLK